MLLLWHTSDAARAIAGPASDCAAQALALTREEAELPRLEFTSPADRPPYCITLETIMAFADRLKSHVALCPQSTHAPLLSEWDRKRASHAKLFAQYRCKRAL